MENKNNIPEIDPKKLFDEKWYCTIVIKNQEDEAPIEKKKKSKISLSDTILSLIDTNKTELLKTLKDVKAQETLIELIKNSIDKDYLAKLIALCWESGLDFSKHATLFFELSLNKDVFVSLEALTVLENIEHFATKEILHLGIEQLKNGVNSNHPNKGMLENTRLLLFEKFKTMES